MNQRPARVAFPLISAAPLGSSTWLLHLRAFAVAGQLVTILAAGWLTGIQLRYTPLLALVALTAITNIFYALWLSSQRGSADATLDTIRSPSSESPDEVGDRDDPVTPVDAESPQSISTETVPVDTETDSTFGKQSVALSLMLLDLATLTAMLFYSGGAANPFSFFYFVNLAVGGVMIHPKAAWSLTLVAMTGYAIILRWSIPVEGISLPYDRPGYDMRAIGSMLAFGTCASVVTYFVTRTSGLLRERERQLRDNERAQAANRRLESLTTLAAGAAHELATPLSTIDVVARELSRHLDDVEKPATVSEDLKLIDHQLDLCRQILQRMRGAAGDSMARQWFKTTVGDLIDATLEGVRDPHRVDVVDGSVDVESQTLWVPQEAVAQAIRNLIHNGLDASGIDGRVRVESRIESGTVHFVITDQGQGMTDEVLGRIGDPFFTTKEPGRGIGLGLYLTRNVVSQLGGHFNLRSEPGRGTSAVVTLPLSKPKEMV